MTRWWRAVDADDGQPCIEIAKVNDQFVIRYSGDGRSVRFPVGPTIDFLVGVKGGDLNHLDLRLERAETARQEHASCPASTPQQAPASQDSDGTDKDLLLRALIVAVAIGVALIAGVIAVWGGIALPIAVLQGGAALGGTILVITGLLGVVYRRRRR